MHLFTEAAFKNIAYMHGIWIFFEYCAFHTLYYVCRYVLGFLFSREKRGIEEFDGEEFLTRKTDEKSEELFSLK